MSIARVHAQKSRKERACEKCRAEIHPGDQYLSFTVGFRSHYQHVRCTKATCAPRQSELESSSLAEVYAAQEDFETSIDQAGDGEELEAAFEELKSAIEDYASARREAAEAWVNGNSQMEEAADEWEGKASDLEGCWDLPDFDDDDERRQEWLDEQREELRSAVSDTLG